MTRATTATTDASGILLAPVVAGDPGQRVRISSAGPDLVLSKKEVCQLRRTPHHLFRLFFPFPGKKVGGRREHVAPVSRLHDSAPSEPWPRRQNTEARAGRSTSAAAIEPHVYRVMISADVMVFAVAVFLMAVMLVRILQRYDDRLYSRPHDQELQNLFKCHLQLAHVLEDELTRWLFTELDVVDPVEQGDQADRGSSSRTRADDAARQHNMPLSDILNVALTVSSFLGLGNTAVFLLEQGALVNAPLKEPGVQLVQQLMRGLLRQRRLSGASLETGSVQATAFSSRSQTGIGEATPWSDVVDGKSHGQPLSQVPKEEWHVDPDSQPQHATRSPLHKHEIKDRHLDGRLLLGATPLHMAAIAGHADIVAMLCQFGADVLVCNAAGLCPLDIVAPCAQDQCVCECNMVWGAGCRAQRTRAVLRQVARNVQRAARAGRLLDRIALLCPQRVLQVASALSAAWSGAVQAAGRQTSAASRGFGHSGIMSSLVYTMLATATFSVLALFPLETISFDWFHVSVDGIEGFSGRESGLSGEAQNQLALQSLQVSLMVLAVYLLAHWIPRYSSSYVFESPGGGYGRSPLSHDAQTLAAILSLPRARRDLVAPRHRDDSTRQHAKSTHMSSALGPHVRVMETSLSDDDNNMAQIDENIATTRCKSWTHDDRGGPSEPDASAIAPQGNHQLAEIRSAARVVASGGVRVSAAVSAAVGMGDRPAHLAEGPGPGNFVVAAVAAAAAGAAAAQNVNASGPAGEAHALNKQREQKERELKEAQWSVAKLEREAEELFAASDHENALKKFSEIRALSGTLLRWSDQEKMATLCARQAACSLALARKRASDAQYLDAIKAYSAAFGLLSDCPGCMLKSDIMRCRLERDECLLFHVRNCCDAEACAQVLRCVQSGIEVQRPPTLDSGIWKTWREKDKNLLVVLLEGRIEQLRDLGSGVPTFHVGKDKFESVLLWCEKVQASADASEITTAPSTLPSMSLDFADGAGHGLGDANAFAVEALLWMAAADFGLASMGCGNINIVACQDALLHVQQARVLVASSAIAPCDSSLASVELFEADYVNGILGSKDRRMVCEDMTLAISNRQGHQERELKERELEEQQVQRALEDQRKLEEAAKTAKKKEAEERQRKARLERQRKETEKKLQQIMDKEETVRKKAEEAAARKREEEEKRKLSALRARQEEEARMKREEEERLQAEALERARTQAIQEALARQRKEKEEREKENQRAREKERLQARDRQKAAARQSALDAKSGVAAKKKVASGLESGQQAEEGCKTAANAVNQPRTTRPDVQHMLREVDRLVNCSQHEDVVNAVAQVLDTSGAELSKQEVSRLVDQQRRSILDCVRQGASRGFALALPALVSKQRDFRKDPVDHVLICLALGDVDEALAVCEGLRVDPVLDGVNLHAEALVLSSVQMHERDRVEQALVRLTRAIQLDESRRHSLQPHLNLLLAKTRSAHAELQHHQQHINRRMAAGQHLDTLQQPQPPRLSRHAQSSFSTSASVDLPLPHSSLPGIPVGDTPSDSCSMRTGMPGLDWSSWPQGHTHASDVNVVHRQNGPDSDGRSYGGMPMNRGILEHYSVGNAGMFGDPFGPALYADNPAYGARNDESFIITGNQSTQGAISDSLDAGMPSSESNVMSNAVITPALAPNYFHVDGGSDMLDRGMGMGFPHNMALHQEGSGMDRNGAPDFSRGHDLQQRLNTESFAHWSPQGLGSLERGFSSQPLLDGSERTAGTSMNAVSNAVSSHHRSDSMDHCLDEILSMPWLVDDSDIGAGGPPGAGSWVVPSM